MSATASAKRGQRRARGGGSLFSRALDELLGPARLQGDGFARAAAILRRAAAREGVVPILPRRCQISVASAVADRHNASYQR